jgi:hypothetical protein
MQLGTLTAQGLQARRDMRLASVRGLSQAAESFMPFGSLGDSRPAVDYVRSGDVIRIVLLLDTSFSGLQLDAFRNYLANLSALRIVNLDASGLGTVLTGYSGNLIIEVQARSDFSKLDDVTRLVAGTAQSAGLNVLLSSSRGEFVSKVEDTGGNVPSNIPAPNQTSSGLGNSLSTFASGLTSSPVTLAVIVVGVVVLVIAAKK